MNVLRALSLAVLLASPPGVPTEKPPPAKEPEFFFRGTGIQIAKAFTCGGVQPAGRYGLEALRLTGERSTLRVSKGETTLCEVSGSSTPNYEAMKVSKVRIFNRINMKAKSIEIDVVVPTAARKRIPNQAYFLPLAP